MSGNVVYKFRDVGEFLVGVPGRDLDDDDVAALSDEQRAELDGYIDGGGKAYRLSKDVKEAVADTPPAKSSAAAGTTASDKVA